MVKFKAGDRVTIIEREQTPADQKSGLYYPHFAGLSGAILKVYGEEVSVLVDRETLPSAIRKRHEDNEDHERKRYLDRLSEDAKSKLGQKEKEFSLQYAVLVAVVDLKAEKPGATAKRLSAAELDAAEEEFLKQRQKGT
jgi:ribosomal protein L21E